MLESTLAILLLLLVNVTLFSAFAVSGVIVGITDTVLFDFTPIIALVGLSVNFVGVVFTITENQ